MDFEEQRQRANAVLNRKGLPRRAAEPPSALVLRALGCKLRPFAFESFWRAVFLSAAWFSPCWGLAMWFWRWRGEGLSVPGAVLVALLTGLFFGLSMACYLAYYRKKHQLPTWESLATPHGGRDA